MEKKTFLGGLITGVLLTVITLESPLFTPKQVPIAPDNTQHAAINPSPEPTRTSEPAGAISDVMPANYDLGVSFGDTIVKMVQAGAIDKEKFVSLYSSRQALTQAQLQLLTNPSSEPVFLDKDNAGLLLNLFWPLGIANKSEVLSSGPLGTQYKDDAGNMASTGGWSLAKGNGGQYLNSLSLIRMTDQQQKMVADMAMHVYRPCCNNHTYFPDCNHGAAMLGYIELAVAQGLPPQRIYKNALVLNAYWFPQYYTALATYYKAKRNLDWKNVDAVEALGSQYSSIEGSGVVMELLQKEGLLPKEQDSGGCGA